jgi:hypothetical protein
MAKQHKLTIADVHLQFILTKLTEAGPWRAVDPIVRSIMQQLEQAAAAEKHAADNSPPASVIEAAKDQVATPNGHTTKAPLI